ncbi:MAG: NAD-dependent epimerase/dehydratase family protein [Thermoleophilaceae bacterium]
MRYVITGGSGYIGSRLVDLLSRREDTERIAICDLAPPALHRPKTEFERVDVRDRSAVRAVLERVRPDALVHLAFILNPSHDEHLMYDVDVNGTHNVLEAAAAAGTGQVLVTSSSTAYGAFPDNPVPLTEEDPVRGVASFAYARDKTESDRLCQLWAARWPERTMTIVRPCIVFGPNVDNYLVRLWTKQPFAADAGGVDNQIQFVHEDDVVEAITALLLGRHGGAFNVAGDGTMTLRECAELIESPIRRLPLRAYRALARVMWAARLSEAPPGQIEFGQHPWIVSTEKLRETTGWRPKHTSRETFELTMRAHGKLPPAGAPAGDRTTATLAA